MNGSVKVTAFAVAAPSLGLLPPCPSPYYLFGYQYFGSLASHFSPAS